MRYISTNTSASFEQFDDEYKVLKNDNVSQKVWVNSGSMSIILMHAYSYSKRRVD
jgi:hypothetical protein